MARSIKTKVIVSVLVLVFVLIGIASLATLFNMFFPDIFRRHVRIEYYVDVSSKKGESLKDVTLVLPFPHHKEKPVKELLKSLKDNLPGAEARLVKTKYGQMLKVYFPEIKDGKYYGARGEYEFEESRFLPLPSKRFVLKPRFEVVERTFPHRYGGLPRRAVSYTVIYADYKGGSELILRGLYEGSESHFDIFSWWPTGERFHRCLGCDSVPYDWDFRQPVDAKIKGKGWMKTPVAEI